MVGLEPSCLLCLRDEIPSLLPGKMAESVASQALLFEEFWIREKPSVELASKEGTVLVHGHCHQKAFDAVKPLEQFLEQIPGLDVRVIDSGCCGMAGVFGYGAETYEVSMKMGELALFPAVRNADLETMVVADGASCRHQIEHGTGRIAQHAVRLLRQALIGTAKS